MLALSGGVLALCLVFAVIGLVAGTGFVYASLILTLVVAALLPMGVLRRAVP